MKHIYAVIEMFTEHTLYPAYQQLLLGLFTEQINNLAISHCFLCCYPSLMLPLFLDHYNSLLGDLFVSILVPSLEKPGGSHLNITPVASFHSEYKSKSSNIFLGCILTASQTSICFDAPPYSALATGAHSQLEKNKALLPSWGYCTHVFH